MLNYPIKFTPILKERIWGGDKLKTLLHKNSTSKNLGESWEISDVEENTSIVANGTLKGKSLQQLLEIYKDKLIGKKNFQHFGAKFPLLIKFIDAKRDLSVQVHPNDKLAKERHNSFGKTEMWYVMQANENANLIIGFNKKLNKEKYVQKLENKQLSSILNFEKVEEGSVFFIETGTVHAIGAGILLAEIQQTSDITYRIYDWDRVDNEGYSRELHTELAIEALNFNTAKNAKVKYNICNNELSQVVSCKYFKTNVLKVSKFVELDYSKTDSFVIFMCVEGELEITCNNFTERLLVGETILIPAIVNKVTIKSSCKLLEVTV